VRAVVDGPGVGRYVGARGEARHQCVEAASEAFAAQPGAVGRITEAKRSARQQALDIGLRQAPADAGVRPHWQVTACPARSSARTVDWPMVPVAPRTTTRIGRAGRRSKICSRLPWIHRWRTRYRRQGTSGVGSAGRT